jgi:hypothetical protein
MHNPTDRVQVQTCQLGGTYWQRYNWHRWRSQRPKRTSQQHTCDTTFDPADPNIDQPDRQLQAPSYRGNIDPAGIRYKYQNYSIGRLDNRTGSPRLPRATRLCRESIVCRRRDLHLSTSRIPMCTGGCSWWTRQGRIDPTHKANILRRRQRSTIQSHRLDKQNYWSVRTTH